MRMVTLKQFTCKQLEEFLSSYEPFTKYKNDKEPHAAAMYFPGHWAKQDPPLTEEVK